MNTASGSLIDEKALARALKDKDQGIRAAALDVHEVCPAVIILQSAASNH